MATGGHEHSEDSGYISVTAPQPRMGTSKETNELNAIKALNRNLNLKVNTLQQKINEHKTEKMNMIRRPRRETAKSREIQTSEIKGIKLTFENVRKTEKELQDKIDEAEKYCKYRTEYEKQKHEISALKKRIKELEEQIVMLDNTVAEKDKEIRKATKQNVDLSSEKESHATKDDIEAMKNTIVGKMDAMERTMENMSQLFAQQMQSQRTESDTGRSERNRHPLPPIARPTPQSSSSTERPDWKL